MAILTTERLLLERVVATDTNFIYRLLNSPSWLQFIGDRGIHSEADALGYIQQNLIAAYDRCGYGLFKMTRREDGLPLGLCGFIKRDYLEHADLGFAILPAFAGQGYTYEAASALLAFGRAQWGLSPVLAITMPENMNSRNLLHKLGFAQSGTVQPSGTEKPLLLYRLLVASRTIGETPV